ncbi:nuclear egress membrane protein [Human alphaherpesvirus 1]|uniref:Nuclear egress membrane protein n=1 Tax=Human herpesvirus 1 TaxID=10298 RepID=A0A1C3J6G6_HHV1|nr:UL34 [Human alphaherpesvirus 1]AWW11507.1 UL34 [Human alphaherpesvirus 1]WPC90435.1 nuclear egress membrane protein [Human alphaherpesvirus 1]SBS69283.1 nuclear egress membrane protein [Human alphaherpesvirus 1]
MAGLGKPYTGHPGDAFEGLVQRIRLIVPSTLRGGDGEAGPYSPSSLPSRCAFQFHGHDGSDESFPIEYVLRLMNDWAEVPCNPYLRIQNTGVSVLFQGFFHRPHNAPGGAITPERTNVILGSTETTGLSLGDLDTIKGRLGLDARPMMASMWISCFVRMPRVQLAFRFMGPEDAGRTRRILCRAAEQAITRRRRTRRSREAYGAEAGLGVAGTGFRARGDGFGPLPLLTQGPSRPWHQALRGLKHLRFGPPALVLAAGLVLGAAIWWVVGAGVRL